MQYHFRKEQLEEHLIGHRTQQHRIQIHLYLDRNTNKCLLEVFVHYLIKKKTEFKFEFDLHLIQQYQ